jgi:RNA polymerase sigma-70 factor, ECF subfamily
MNPAMHSDTEFAAAFREHYPYVLRLATVMTGDVDLAKDVAQEVFLAVFKGLGAFRGDSSLRTWIYQITLRTCARCKARGRRHAGDVLDDEAITGSETADSTAALSELIAALERLPLPSRAVLSLVAIEGLSHDEAAQVLGVPVGTVASRLHTARHQLAAALNRC